MIWSWRISLVALCLTAALPVLAQNTDDLPSAPSAVKQPKPTPSTPAPQPAPEVEQSEPAQPAASATDLSDPRDKSDANAPLSDPNTIRVPVNEVNVVFTVTDKHNHYVKDLSKT